MDDLVAAGVAGIMVSAVDPKTETEALNNIASQIPLFTTDSDAPQDQAHRLYRLDNIDAGKQAGELIRRCPNGGKCMGFVGLPCADNARERIQGMQRDDQGHQDRARRRSRRRHRPGPRQAQRRGHADRHPDVTCLVGFYSYNTPQIYEAVKEAGKLGKIKIVGFDEDPVTLGGVKEGTIIGTVVQQPYEWGYQGMKLMAKYVEGDKSVIPAEPPDHHPDQDHRQDQRRRFWAELKERTGAK